jgi:hypothetical protein
MQSAVVGAVMAMLLLLLLSMLIGWLIGAPDPESRRVLANSASMRNVVVVLYVARFCFPGTHIYMVPIVYLSLMIPTNLAFNLAFAGWHKLISRARRRVCRAFLLEPLSRPTHQLKAFWGQPLHSLKLAPDIAPSRPRISTDSVVYHRNQSSAQVIDLSGVSDLLGNRGH